jgi:hypothetical protein
MDLQKIRIRIREDLGRMVRNYFLREEITADQYARICVYIDTIIGSGTFPKPEQGRGRSVIPFPTSYTGPAAREDSAPKEQFPPYFEWCENFKGTGFGRMILRTLYYLHINSLEELSKTPLKKIRECRNIGDKSLAIIQAVLEKNGFTTTAEDQA